MALPQEITAISILDFKIGWNYKGRIGLYTIWHEPFKRQMADWTRAWRRIVSEVLVAFVVKQFGSEGGEGQRAWAELAPTTLRRRLYPGKPILQQTGMLQMSFLGGPDHVEEIEAKRMKWGSAARYAVFHQRGTGIKYGDASPRGYEFMPSLKTRKGAASAGGHWEPTEKGRGMPQRPLLDFYALLSPTFGKAFSSWNKKMRNIVRHELREAARRAGFAEARRVRLEITGPEALERGDILLGNI